MRWLTYADRDTLLQAFTEFRSKWNGTNDALIATASDWVASLEPSFGFEHALARDVITLCRYLQTHEEDDDVVDIARGALLYVTSAQAAETRLQDLELLDEAFMCAYALQEIRVRLGDPATYTPPRLTKAEQDHAENLFLGFVDEPLLPDEQLVHEVKAQTAALAGLAYSGLFWRLRKNVEFLCQVLLDANRSNEEKEYARAALSYVRCEHDAIDDSLGLIGYLDDNFIVQMAVDFIDPNREPWLDLLDVTIAAWPFLNQLLIETGDSPLALSEYMIVNSALSCAEIRDPKVNSTMVVTPIVGPIPFLVGTVAALGIIQELGEREVTEESFRIGEKLLVDNSAVAEFAGIKTINGRRMFGLKQYRRQRGQQSPRARTCSYTRRGRHPGIYVGNRKSIPFAEAAVQTPRVTS